MQVNFPGQRNRKAIFNWRGQGGSGSEADVRCILGACRTVYLLKSNVVS